MRVIECLKTTVNQKDEREKDCNTHTSPHSGRRSLVLHLKVSQAASKEYWQKYFCENYYATHKF
jgi:hypothetical protein